jgi:hypothetical protein
MRDIVLNRLLQFRSKLINLLPHPGANSSRQPSLASSSPSGVPGMPAKSGADANVMITDQLPHMPDMLHHLLHRRTFRDRESILVVSSLAQYEVWHKIDHY